MTGTRRRIKHLVKGKGITCPVCSSDHGCAIFDPPTYCICLRVQDGCMSNKDGSPMAVKNGLGWLHRIDGKDHKKTKDLARRLKTVDVKRLTQSEIKSILKDNRSAMTAKMLSQAAEKLRLSERALEAYGIGWDGQSGCWSFPMFDGALKPVGIRLRGPDGRKLCVAGSANGIFVPKDFNTTIIEPFELKDREPYCVLMPEGPTSAAAAFDLGFIAVGRPSNSGGIIEITQLLRRHPHQDVTIVADRDGVRYMEPSGKPFFPGFEGALSLAEQVLPVIKGRLRFIQTPKGTKDLRQWVEHGGTWGMLNRMLNESDTVTREWIDAKHAEVERWREGLWKRKKAG